jgi:hypothetical protein
MSREHPEPRPAGPERAARPRTSSPREAGLQRVEEDACPRGQAFVEAFAALSGSVSG